MEPKLVRPIAGRIGNAGAGRIAAPGEHLTRRYQQHNGEQAVKEGHRS
jgi:hypothetical protein